MKRRRQGFTLMEMLTVIGVILILAAITIIGMKVLAPGAEKDQTRVALQAAASMLNEYEQAGGDMGRLDAVFMNAMGWASMRDLPAPTNGVNTDAFRTGREVRATRRVMTLLIKDPNVKKILDSTAQNRVDNTSPADGPILLDGQGNPILYVPRYGLSGVNLLRRADGSGFDLANQRIYSPERADQRDPANPSIVYAKNNNNNTTGKAFFASAGPELNFSWGDKHVYSFKQ